MQNLFFAEVRLIINHDMMLLLMHDRVRKLGEKLPPFVTKNTAPYWQTIEERYKAVAADLQGLNAYRYSRQITGGNQEFMEALSFQHYLETQQLISFDESKKRLTELSGEGGPVMFTVDDYLLGIYDMTGELMRFSVTAIATNGKLPTGKAPKSPSKTEDGDAMEVDEQACDTKEQQKPRDVLSDLRELRLQLEMFEPPAASPFASDVEKKMVVMQQCVQKVETALYGLIVRGSERPKGWVPDLNEGRGIESY